MEIVAEQRFYEQVEALRISIEFDIDVPDTRFFDLSSQYITLLLCLSLVYPVWFISFILTFSF